MGVIRDYLERTGIRFGNLAETLEDVGEIAGNLYDAARRYAVERTVGGLVERYMTEVTIRDRYGLPDGRPDR